MKFYVWEEKPIEKDFKMPFKMSMNTVQIN